MADNRTISQLEAEGYPWIGCECCKGTVWVPFRMLRERIPMLSAMMLDQLGASVLNQKFVASDHALPGHCGGRNAGLIEGCRLRIWSI